MLLRIDFKWSGLMLAFDCESSFCRDSSGRDCCWHWTERSTSVAFGPWDFCVELNVSNTMQTLKGSSKNSLDGWMVTSIFTKKKNIIEGMGR